MTVLSGFFCCTCHFYIKFSLNSAVLKEFSFSEYFQLFNVLFAFYNANHLVNPILFAIRKWEYRSALLVLFQKRPQWQRRVADSIYLSMTWKQREGATQGLLRILKISELNQILNDLRSCCYPHARLQISFTGPLSQTTSVTKTSFRFTWVTYNILWSSIDYNFLHGFAISKHYVNVGAHHRGPPYVL